MAELLDADPAVFADESLALQYVINTIINNKVNTTELVRVLSVDEQNKEISVIPIVKNVDAKGNAIEESEIYGVRYIMWQYGANAIQALPQVGDVGLILVSKRDISKIETGIVDSRRKFNLADSIYIGGLCGFNQSPTQFIKFNENGIEITSPTAISLTAPNATINASGNVDLTAQNVNVNSESINLGGVGGSAVARIGDAVAGGVIVGGSSVVKAV